MTMFPFHSRYIVIVPITDVTAEHVVETHTFTRNKFREPQKCTFIN